MCVSSLVASLASVMKGKYKVYQNVAPPAKDIYAAHCTPATIVSKSLNEAFQRNTEGGECDV